MPPGNAILLVITLYQARVEQMLPGKQNAGALQSLGSGVRQSWVQSPSVPLPNYEHDFTPLRLVPHPLVDVPYNT